MIMIRIWNIAKLAAVLVFTWGLTACVHNSVEDFHFIRYSGLKIPLVEDPSTKPGNEGRLIADGDTFRTPYYQLKEPLSIDDENRSFFIVYNGKGELTLDLRVNGASSLYALPVLKGRDTEYRVELAKDSLLEGFLVKSAGDGGEICILGSGLEESFNGAELDNDPALIGTGVSPLSSMNGFAIDPSMIMKNGISQLKLQIESGSHTVSEIVIDGTAGESQRYVLSSRTGENRIDLHLAQLPFIPERILFPDNTLRPIALFAEPQAVGNEALGIDVAALLEYPQNIWRNSEYEVFRWNLLGNMLIFDFADYRQQAAYLKRLAFFVEKEGYRGRLVPDDELELLHGWNAHDYRAEDVARFFQAAADAGFTLNLRERRLEEVLIDNGVLIRSGSRILPGLGGFLSISRESGEYLRNLFLTHEGMHGLFFSDPGFRAYTRSLWDSFSETEKNFWKTFFSYRRYDPDDEYLVVNELQAYLLQQPLDAVDAYYKDYTLPNMIVRQPETADVVKQLLEEYPDHFISSASFLDKYLQDKWGVGAGDLKNLNLSLED